MSRKGTFSLLWVKEGGWWMPWLGLVGLRPVPLGAWDVPASCCPLSACISVTPYPRGGRSSPLVSPGTWPVTLCATGRSSRWVQTDLFLCGNHVVCCGRAPDELQLLQEVRRCSAWVSPVACLSIFSGVQEAISATSEMFNQYCLTFHQIQERGPGTANMQEKKREPPQLQALTSLNHTLLSHRTLSFPICCSVQLKPPHFFCPAPCAAGLLLDTFAKSHDICQAWSAFQRCCHTICTLSLLDCHGESRGAETVPWPCGSALWIFICHCLEVRKSHYAVLDLWK